METELADWKRVRFVTLTLRHSQTPLSDQIDRLLRSFKELRRWDAWKSAVKGSAAFAEIKISDSDGLWHPHLHVLCVGSWIDARELSARWHAITGDSSIVKIEEARTKNGVASYVTKYVTKPLDSTVLRHPDRLREAIVALKGRRLVNGAGCLRRISDSRADADGVDDWHTIGELADLLGDARTGNAAAQIIVDLVRTRVSLRSERDRSPPS